MCNGGSKTFSLGTKLCLSTFLILGLVQFLESIPFWFNDVVYPGYPTRKESTGILYNHLVGLVACL